MAARFILPALALVGTVLAQCDGPSITISTSADAEQIASCQKYNGNVIIDSSATGTIALNGVQQITGDLQCLNATLLNAITSDQLNTIGGTFNLNGLIVLSTLQFSSLSGVNHINWINLPALQALQMGQGISKANSVIISNTQLNTLNGIELTQVGMMDINNNPYLDTINVNTLANVTNSLSFSANGQNLDISFPNLLNAANLTFRNVSSIEMPSLNIVPGAMGFYSDTFSNFSAPNLTSIGGTLAFSDCPDLTAMNFPRLTTIGGGFLLSSNDQLMSIDGLPMLHVIGGAIAFQGAFSSVNVNNITDVRGSANVTTSSSNSTICSLFNAARSRQIIKGTVYCSTAGNKSTNGTSTGGSSGSGSKSGASSLTSSFTAPLTGIVGLAAAMLFL